MSIAIAAAVAVLATCEWHNPRGAFRVNVPPADLVANYPEIPADVQHELVQKMRARAYDDLVLIKKDSLTGIGGTKYSDFRKMHFGATGSKMCETLTLNTWTADEKERALVYCAKEWCVAVPTVCNNTSLITRLPPEPGPPLILPPIESPPMDVTFSIDPGRTPGQELPPVAPPEDDLVPPGDTISPPPGRTWPPSWYSEPFWFWYDLTPVPVLWRAPPETPEIDVASKVVDSVQAVPEASTLVYMALGLAMIAAFRKRFI